MLFIGFIIISLVGIGFIFLFWTKPSVTVTDENNSESVSELSNDISEVNEIHITYDEPSNVQTIELDIHKLNTVDTFIESERLVESSSSEEHSNQNIKTNSIINPFNF